VIQIGRAEALAMAEREARALPPRFGGCAMCAVVARHGADLEVLAEREAAVAVLDRFAARPGHVLVVLRRHAERVGELSWAEYAAVQRLAWEAARVLEEALQPRRVYIAALGSADRRAISFPHHHVHVVPLPHGDERDRPAEVFTWARGVALYEPGEARAMAEALRRAWPAGAAP
jgi:diadenosine tetraphosphate (Ap4A) HIT family hydrolase